MVFSLSFSLFPVRNVFHSLPQQHAMYELVFGRAKRGENTLHNGNLSNSSSFLAPYCHFAGPKATGIGVF